MHTHYLLIHKRTHWHHIEHIRKEFPQFEVVLSLAFDKSIFTFVIEAINPVNGGAFVIPPQQKEVFRVLDLISQHERNAFDGLFSSINIIAEEEIVLIAGIATVFEELDQV